MYREVDENKMCFYVPFKSLSFNCASVTGSWLFTNDDIRLSGQASTHIPQITSMYVVY